MENMEKSLSERMNEKFSEFDKRITSIEVVFLVVMDTSDLVVHQEDGVPPQHA